MTRKILCGLVLVAFSAAIVRAADPPAGLLVPTPLAPAAVIALTPAPEPVQLPLNWGDSSLTVQATLAVPRSFPGFRASGDPEKTLFDINLVALVALNTADYFTTRQALKYPGLREANPLMQPFVKSPAAFAAAKIGTTVLTCWSLKALFKRNRAVAWVLGTASNVLTSYVVASNLQRIRHARVQ
jgi:hypothetical protein